MITDIECLGLGWGGLRRCQLTRDGNGELNLNWLRLYTDALHKRKVQSLPGELFKAWINFLLIARQHDGYLIPVPDIAFELHVSDEVAETWLLALIHRGLFDRTPKGVRPHDWDEHQYPSDDSAKRKRIWRAKERGTGHVPMLSRARADKNRKEVTPSGVTATPAAETKPSTIEEARLLIAAYPSAKDLSGAPDSSLAAQCLALAGDMAGLVNSLRAMHLTGKKPDLSWGWFPTVLQSYVRRQA